MRSLRGNIVRIFMVMSIANTIMLVVIYFSLLTYVTYQINAPLSMNRFLPTIMQHYYKGGTNSTLHISINQRLRLYDSLSVRPPRVASQDLRFIYPLELYGTQINALDEYPIQYRIELPNNSVIYLLPYDNPSDYPIVSTYYPYLFGGIGVGLLISTILSAIAGTFFAIQSIKPLEILTALSTASVTKKPLQQVLTPYSTREIHQLASAIDKRDSEIQHQIMLRRQLNADIAHELRNPLNTIGGYIEAMRDGVLTVTPARLDTIYDELQSLHQLVDDLRLLAQSDSHDMTYVFQPLLVVDLINKTYEIMEPYAQKHRIQLTKTSINDDAYIYADTSHMLRVLRNVIDNAVRHSNPQSTVELKTNITDEQIVIQVIDYGCGIHPDDLRQLFNRYFRARNTKGNGSGLGLPIAQAIVIAHQGSITATSELNIGTTITITLPRYIEHELL
ncbi:MAG: sensor histidine kinase [Chloroflexota bacterium]|jgi:two-component system sensor histidine kinase BaeS